MRMIKFNRNLFIVAILLSNSCSDFLSDSNNSIALIPFKLNNQWEYADTKYDSSGNIWLADTIIYRVDKDTIINNQRLYRYDSYFFYTIKSDGIWMYEFIGDSTRQTLFLKYPCNIGDTYLFTFGRPNTVTVTSLNEKVTVEAGEYSCIKYHFEYYPSSPYVNIYVKPGLGIIKQESFSGDKYYPDYKTGEESLLRYQLY